MTTVAEIAERFKLKPSGRGEFRGACISCGYPDALVLRQGKFGPMGWCASCQDTSAIKAALRAAGIGGTITCPESEMPRRSSLAGALATWSNALPCTLHDPGGRYLTWRGLAAIVGSPAFRFLKDCSHPCGNRAPALICAAQDIKGEIVGVQRIYVTPDGRKAGLEPQKAAKGSTWRAAVRLNSIAPEILIGEGIETSASAGMLLGLPAWAAISAGNLAMGLILPPEVRSVIIAADDDGVNRQGRNPGLEAAEAAARRWQAEGRKVRIVKPDTPGKDFNDVALARIANGGLA